MRGRPALCPEPPALALAASSFASATSFYRFDALCLAGWLQMRDAPKDSRMAPSVHAYTAAMRAASEGGRWEAALAIWDDMLKAGCKPTGEGMQAGRQCLRRHGWLCGGWCVGPTCYQPLLALVAVPVLSTAACLALPYTVADRLAG